MSEEFVEDIIAKASKGDAQVVLEGDEHPEVAPEVAPDDEAKVAENKVKSDSTTVDDTITKTVSATESVDDAVAPGTSTEVEELASQLGWNKDHKGADAVDASTYILRSKDIQKTMKDHNKDLKNQLNGLQGSVESLKVHNERVYKADVKRLQSELTKLKADKKAAVELADVAKVAELDQQIDEVQKDIAAPVVKDVHSLNPAYDTWIADNQWYLTDPAMAKYADAVADQYEGAPLDRVYDLVRQKVAEVFPDKFMDKTEVATTTPAEKATVDKVVGPKSPVEQGSRTGEAESFTKADLSPEQLTIMKQFVNGGIMTEDQYVADIAKMQEA